MTRPLSVALAEALDALAEGVPGVAGQLVAEPFEHIVHGDLEGQVKFVGRDRGCDDCISQGGGLRDIMVDDAAGHVASVVPGQLFQFPPDGPCGAGWLWEMCQVFDFGLDCSGRVWAEEVVQMVEEFQEIETLPNQGFEGGDPRVGRWCWFGGSW